MQKNEEIEEEEYVEEKNLETEEYEQQNNDEIQAKKYEEHKEIEAEEYDVQKNEEVQAEEYSRNNSTDHFFTNRRQQTLMEFGFCPTCYLSLNILRGGGLTRILKDEQTEAMTKSPSCDKSTSKTVVFLEKTTSLTNKPVLKYSNLTFIDNTSDTSVHQRHIRIPSSREVTFTMDYVNELASSGIPSPPRPPSPPKYSSSCVYTENAMLQVSSESLSSPLSPPSPPGHLRYPPDCMCSHINEFINAIKPPPPWDIM